MGKRFFYILCLFVVTPFLGGCTTNPATGDSQFTALMSPQQEMQVGAEEHQKVMKEYGLYKDSSLQAYVNQVGRKVVTDTERPDVLYKFFLLDTPMVNAFALPGGYIYVTRGVMALAGSEAELAAVLAHEAGHITARHSAERYSRGVVTTLGAAILSAAIGSDGASQALGVGSDLYLKSYSRKQESEADSLGLRYMSRAGYNVRGMSIFLSNLQADTALSSKISGQSSGEAGMDYFSTHPATSERVSSTLAQAAQYPQGGVINKDGYLRKLDGMVYGDNAAQGFVRGQHFYHPDLGFAFSVPEGYHMNNTPSKVVASAAGGSLVVFDMANNPNALSPQRFVSDVWLQGNQSGVQVDGMLVNGMQGATASFEGSVNGQSMTIRVVAIAWSRGQVARFLLAYPQNASAARVDALKRATYSFHRMSAGEKARVHPYRIKIVTAGQGDSVASLARRMVFDDYREARFRVLNDLGPTGKVQAGHLYKIVVD